MLEDNPRCNYISAQKHAQSDLNPSRPKSGGCCCPFRGGARTFHITSHWDDRCRPRRPLYPRNKCLSYEFTMH